jgi:hypothetical protein
MNQPFAVGLAAVFLILAASAQAGPNSADGKAIEACLTAAREKGTGLTTCIGIVADPCIAKAARTNAYIDGSKACATRELGVWEARMQRAIKEGARGGTKDMATAVASAQKTWADSVARLCPLYDKIDPEMALGGAIYCRLHHTAIRTLALERLAAAVNPH